MKSINPILSNLIAKSNSNQIAITEKGRSFTYKEIFNDSRKLATYLKTIGVEKGDTTLIATQVGYEFLLIFYATIILKVKIAIIDPQMGNELYLSKLKQLNPKWSFIDSRLLLLQEHPILRYLHLKFSKNKFYIPGKGNYQTIATGPWIPLVRSFQRLSQYHIYQPIEIDPTFHDYEYIITYTSGTLSEPKGVVHSLSTLTTSVKHIVKLLDKTQNRSLVTHLPHFMLLGVSSGINVHIWQESWSAKRKLNFIEKHNISILFGPPSDFLELIQYCKSKAIKIPECVQNIIIGSAPVHVPFLQNLVQYVNGDTRITIMYGMTEHLIVSSTDGREKINYPCKGDYIGDIVEGVNLNIANDGEILIQSNQLYKRYVHLRERTEWHPTGDLGYIDKNGKLILTGRKKNMIIKKNFNIYPALYEPTIKSIPGISEAVIIGKYIEKIADEKIYLIIESDRKISKKYIMTQLTNGKYKIDKEALPDEILFTKIPRKGRQQKIDRIAIRELTPFLI